MISPSIAVVVKCSDTWCWTEMLVFTYKQNKNSESTMECEAGERKWRRPEMRCENSYLQEVPWSITAKKDIKMSIDKRNELLGITTQWRIFI